MNKFLMGLLVLVSGGCTAAFASQAKVSPPCYPIQGGEWSRLAYPMPIAKLPQQACLELVAPNGEYTFIVKGGDYPKVSILNKGKSLHIMLPLWVISLQDSANPRRVQPTGAEFMWAPNSKALAATENYKLARPNIAGGGWRVLVYLIRPPHVKPVFMDEQAAAAYQKKYVCKYLPDVGALKWVGSHKLLLLAQGSVDELCKQNWNDIGYLVSVPSGRIIRTYSQQQLTRWREIFGSAGTYGQRRNKRSEPNGTYLRE